MSWSMTPDILVQRFSASFSSCRRWAGVILIFKRSDLGGAITWLMLLSSVGVSS